MTIPPLIIELANNSYNAALSDETSAYSATLIIASKKVGNVSNHGHGGCDNFQPAEGYSYQTYIDADKRIQAEYPRVALDLGGEITSIESSLEIVCGELLAKHLVKKDVRKSLAKHVVFFKDGLPAEGTRGELLQIAIKTQPVEAVIKQIRTKYPASLILNEHPLDTAVDHFMKAK